MTVLNKQKIYPTKRGNKPCNYVVFQKKVNGNIKETYCGLQAKNSSYIKAYSLEIAHLEKRFEYYYNALMDAKEKLDSYQDISPPYTAKNKGEVIV